MVPNIVKILPLENEENYYSIQLLWYTKKILSRSQLFRNILKRNK